jgi:hypothetical protein
VLAEVRAWQSRPLDTVYPILYLDALIVKVKENGRVINKAEYAGNRCEFTRLERSSRHLDRGNGRCARFGWGL